MDFDEPVWKRDVRDQEEMALDCWKVTYNFYVTLQRQGAPPELLAEMAAVSNHFAEAYKQLNAMQQRWKFPEEPVM